MKETSANTVKTTHTVFAILETLQRMNGARITELGSELDMANSTIHRHLATLHQRGYVVKVGDEYHIGLRFLDLGEHARNREAAYQMAADKVVELAEETDERAQFIVEEHGYGVYVHRALGANAVKTDPGIGKHAPLHATAAGKAIMAFLPSDRLEAVIERHGLTPETENTITSRKVLLAQLDDIRDREYSVNNEEHISGLRAIGAPIKHPTGEIIGAVSVSGPTRRMKGSWFEEDLPDLLRGATNELELNIAHS